MPIWSRTIGATGSSCLYAALEPVQADGVGHHDVRPGKHLLPGTLAHVCCCFLLVTIKQVGVDVVNGGPDSAKMNAKELVYPDFCQAIAALACFYPPVRSPFVPLDEKIAAFITKYLKPMHRSK